MNGHHLSKPPPVSNATFLQWAPFHRPPISPGKVVVDYRNQTLLRYRLTCMTSDITGGTRYENFSVCTILHFVPLWREH